MPRTIPVACIQLRANDRSAFPHAWEHALEMMRCAARQGAQLIVAPEGTVPSYVIGTDRIDPQLIADAAANVREIAAAFGCVIVYGTARFIGERLYNSAAVIGPDGPLGASEKMFLWHFDHRWFTAGTALEPIATPVGRLGVFICADGRVPTIAQTLVDRGAELLVVPTAWVTSGRDPENLENIQADLLARVRAFENGVPLIAANKAGVECRSVAYCGKSTIIDAGGEYVARGSARDEEILAARVTLGEGRPVRAPRSAPLAPVAQQTGISAARVAISAQRDPARLIELAEFAALADCQYFIAPVAPERVNRLAGIGFERGGGEATLVAGGLVVTVVGDEILDPGVLPPMRLRGHDLFLWRSEIDRPRQIEIGRARAAELRAYVIVVDQRPPARAYAIDPDGTIVCGTYDDLEAAVFTYERARTAQTMVVPHTDVLAGLRAVEHVMGARC